MTILLSISNYFSRHLSVLVIFLRYKRLFFNVSESTICDDGGNQNSHSQQANESRNLEVSYFALFVQV